MPVWADLRQRQMTPEVMDQPDLDARDHARALKGLARINAWSGSAGILWPALNALARASSTDELRVLDIATGAGDVPLRLWGNARRSGCRLRIAGCDRSPVAIRTATERAARAGADLEFFALDVLSDPLPTEFDVLTCSLFLHHLDNSQAVTLMRRMAEATRGAVLISDLARGPTGYALAYLGTRVLSRSPIVHTDGPRSVAAAFTPNEAVALAWQAGMNGATSERCWPCRFLLTWIRPEPGVKTG